MRRLAPLAALLAGLTLVAPFALADVQFHTVNLSHAAYTSGGNAWTAPPCEQAIERWKYLPGTFPTTSTPAPGPAYPLHGDGVISGYVQNFHYVSRNHSVNDLPSPTCLSSPPTRDIEVGNNASYVGWLTVPPGDTAVLTFAWKAETVLLWASASGATVGGSCGVYVGSVLVPSTFDPTTATCSATATLTASADLFIHAGADAASPTSPLPPTAAFKSTLTIDVSGLPPHHFEYTSTY